MRCIRTKPAELRVNSKWLMAIPCHLRIQLCFKELTLNAFSAHVR